MKSTMEKINYRPIGTIRSPFPSVEGVPIQPTGAKGAKGTIDIYSEYVDGLQDLEGFSHIILIYHFHLVRESALKVIPFLDDSVRGIFSTRAPKRPNSIGISTVRLRKIRGSTLFIEDVDIVDGTPLLDIKPYVPDFDDRDASSTGWLFRQSKGALSKKADGRFR